jgi:hypothetical protein
VHTLVIATTKGVVDALAKGADNTRKGRANRYGDDDSTPSSYRGAVAEPSPSDYGATSSSFGGGGGASSYGGGASYGGGGGGDSDARLASLESSVASLQRSLNDQDRKLDQVLDLQRQMLRLMHANSSGGGASFRESGGAEEPAPMMERASTANPGRGRRR